MTFKTLSHGQGYYMNDNRASGGAFDEADMIACMHCERPISKHAWRMEGAFCHSCNGPICINCSNIPGNCTGERNFTKRLEQALELDYRRRQNAKTLGI